MQPGDCCKGWVQLADASGSEAGSEDDRKPEVFRSLADTYSMGYFSPILNEKEKHWRSEFVLILFDGGWAIGNNNNGNNNTHLFYAKYQAKHIACIFSFKLMTVMCGNYYYYLHFTREETES